MCLLAKTVCCSFLIFDIFDSMFQNSEINEMFSSNHKYPCCLFDETGYFSMQWIRVNIRYGIATKCLCITTYGSGRRFICSAFPWKWVWPIYIFVVWIMNVVKIDCNIHAFRYPQWSKGQIYLKKTEEWILSCTLHVTDGSRWIEHNGTVHFILFFQWIFFSASPFIKDKKKTIIHFIDH